MEWWLVGGFVDVESANGYLVEYARNHDERHKTQETLQPIVGGKCEGDGPQRKSADELGRENPYFSGAMEVGNNHLEQRTQ